MKNRFYGQTLLIQTAIIALGLCLTFLQAQRYANSIIFGDIIQYLDMSDALSRLDWQNFVNSYWSPLYPVVLALFLKPLHVIPQNEILSLRILNCILTIVGYFCFFRFFRVFRYWLFTTFRKLKLDRQLPSSKSLRIAGTCSAAFTFGTLNNAGNDTPDLLLASLLFLVFALLLEILLRPQLKKAMWLGILLGLAYLCKSIVFLLAPLCALIAGMYKKEAKLAFAILLAFALTASGWLIAISLKEGQPIISTNAYSTFVRTVMHQNQYYRLANGLFLQNPPKIINQKPLVLDYDSSDVQPSGRYVEWWQPNIWVVGTPLITNIGFLIACILENLWFYIKSFAWIILLAWLIPGKNKLLKPNLKALQQLVPILLIPLVMLCLYLFATNLYIYAFCARYILVPAIIFFLVALVIPSTASSGFTRPNTTSAKAMSIIFLLSIGMQLYLHINANGTLKTNLSVSISQYLRQKGVLPNSKIAVFKICYELWHRYVPAKVSVALFNPSDFFKLPLEKQRDVIQKIKASGVKAIVYVPREIDYVRSGPFWDDIHAFELLSKKKLPLNDEENNPIPQADSGWLKVPNEQAYVLILDQEK